MTDVPPEPGAPQPPDLDEKSVRALVEYAHAQSAFSQWHLDLARRLGKPSDEQAETNIAGWDFVALALSESFDDRLTESDDDQSETDPAQPDQAEQARWLEDASERLHIMKPIDDALTRWPEVSALAWAAESTEEFVTQLITLLGIDETQANAVMDQQLRRIPADQRARIGATVSDLGAEIARYKSGTDG